MKTTRPAPKSSTGCTFTSECSCSECSVTRAMRGGCGKPNCNCLVCFVESLAAKPAA